MWQDFHFLRPEWFWLFIPLALLLWLLVRFGKQDSGWQQIIAPHLLNVMMPSASKVARKSPIVRLTGIIGALGIIAGAGPTFERLPQPVFSVEQGHVVVMDMSLSMRATDVSPDRLTRAKFKAIDLVKEINEGEIGLVAYAGDAFVISPLTEDIATLETLLPSLRPEIMPVAGSDALSGLETASELLLQAGYPKGIVYWVTDGVEPEDVDEIRDWLSSTQLTVNILGVGTSSGAPIKQISGELLKDNLGNIVIPKMRINRLAPLARQTGGVASVMSADDSDIKQFISSNLSLQAEKSDEENQVMNGDQWFELGPYLVVVILPFMLYMFRKGVVTVVVLGLTVPLLAPQPVFAESSSSNWTAWFKNSDQQGLEAYNKEAYSDAANSFDDPMWKGSSHYKDGDFESALEAFSQVDSEESWYNRGNALAKMQKLDDAIAAYEEALARKPDFTEAAENKALLEQMKQQQEQQNQDQEGENQDSEQENQDQQNQNEQDQNQDGESQESDQQNDQQNDSQQDQQQNGDSQNQDPPQQEEQQQGQDAESEENNEQQDEQESQSEQEGEQEGEQEQQTQQQMQANEAEMTDEEREKQQQMEALLRRIPNDPAYLLQRKMQLEAQQRNRQRLPASQEKTW